MKFTQLGIIGVTGTGKTYLTANIIYHLMDKTNRIIIIDDLMQLSKELEQRNLSSYFIHCYTIEQFILNIVDTVNFKLILHFEYNEDYDIALSIIWQLNNLVLFVDELSLYCDAFNIPVALKNIAQRGRLKNISLIWNTQRAQNINRNISSQNEFIIAFQLSEINDLRYFYFDRNKVEKILALKKTEYMLVRGDIKTLQKNLFNMRFHLTF